MQVVVHGGAGGAPDEPAARLAVLEDATETGVAAATPLDAVEDAVRILESSPRFNAGVGSAVQSDGEIRTDAGIMTDDRAVGAACSMSGVEHAVSAARVVLEETPHVLVSGEHAVALADAYGVETGFDCWTDRTRERWSDLDAPTGGPKTQLQWLEERYGRTDSDDSTDGTEDSDDAGNDVPGGGASNGSDPSDHDHGHDHDTVGAVAFDGETLAAATSTGGRWLALAGRVGDVPQVGSGFYCSPAGAASATGAGEDIARVTLSRRVVDHIERGVDAQTAIDLAIEEFAELTGSRAGVIAIDADGTCGSAFNSEAMQTARARR